MAYKIVNLWVDPSMYHIKSPYAMKPTSITIHETDNNASAYNEVSYMRRNNNMTSFHVGIDDEYVVQGIPFTRNAWAAGDGVNGEGNRKSLHFETSFNKDNGYNGPISTRMWNAIRNAELYTAYVCVQYGWYTASKVLKQHWHWSRKHCPRKMRDNGYWNDFVAKVQSHINSIRKGVSTSTPAKTPSTPKKTTTSKVSKIGEYTVKNGDSLWKIAKTFKVTIKNLKAWNNLTSDTILVGQKILVRKPVVKKSTAKKKVDRNSWGWEWSGTFVANTDIVVRTGKPGLGSPAVGSASFIKKGDWVNFDHLWYKDGYWWVRFKYAAKGASTAYFFMPIGRKETGVGFATANKNKKLWGSVTKLNSNEKTSGVTNWNKKGSVKVA